MRVEETKTVTMTKTELKDALKDVAVKTAMGIAGDDLELRFIILSTLAVFSADVLKDIFNNKEGNDNE